MPQPGSLKNTAVLTITKRQLGEAYFTTETGKKWEKIGHENIIIDNLYNYLGISDLFE